MGIGVDGVNGQHVRGLVGEVLPNEPDSATTLHLPTEDFLATLDLALTQSSAMYNHVEVVNKFTIVYKNFLIMTNQLFFI